MANRRKIYGISIAGFGDGGLHLLGQDVRLGTDAADNGSVIYFPMIADWPKQITTEVEPLEGSCSQSTISFVFDKLDLLDVSFARYGQRLLEFFWRSRPDAVGRILIALTFSDTSLLVAENAGMDAILAGDIIYIGREAMYVTSVGGSNPQTVNVTRGVLGTVAAPHELDDPEVYLKNPLKIDREVEIFEYDVDTQTESTIWRGCVESYGLDDKTTLLSVTCRDLLGMISKRKLGRDRWSGKVRFFRGELNGVADCLFCHDPDDGPVVDYLPLYPDVPFGFLPGSGVYSGVLDAVKAICLEVDGIAIAVRAEERQAIDVAPLFAAAWRHKVLGGSAIEVSGRLLEATAEGKEFNAYEILVADADSPLSLFRDDSGNTTDHPALIALNILESDGTATWTTGGSPIQNNLDYGWLPGAWGLGLNGAWIDQVSFERLAFEGPTKGLRFRSFYLGGKGANLRGAMEVLSDLMQAMGCYLYMTPAGKIGARIFRDPGISRTDHVMDAQNVLWSREEIKQEMERTKPLYSIALQCAAVGPGGEAGHILDERQIGAQRKARYKYHAIREKLDSTLGYGDPVAHQLSTDEIDKLSALFHWRYIFTQDPIPRYEIELIAGERVTPGQWIALSHPTFWSEGDGSGFLSRGVIDHRVLVIRGDFEFKTGRQKLLVLDCSPVTKANSLLSPSWRVTAFTDATHFSVASDYFSAYSGDWDLFGTGLGFQIDLWTEDGQKRNVSGSRFPTAFLSGAVTLSSSWGVTPAVGNIVRIADYDAWISKVYTWLGDANAQLGGANARAYRWDV